MHFSSYAQFSHAFARNCVQHYKGQANSRDSSLYLGGYIHQGNPVARINNQIINLFVTMLQRRWNLSDMEILKTGKEKLKTTLGIFCKLCCKSSWTTCIFLFSLALRILTWSVIKNTENPLPGLLHQQMLIRATHNHSSSSLKWSFHLSSKRMWACFAIPTSHLFQWVWRLSHHPQDDTGHNYMESIRIRANRLKKKIRKINLTSKCQRCSAIQWNLKNYKQWYWSKSTGLCSQEKKQLAYE